MDINKLELFFTAANSDSFTQAAEKCNVAQTTMSKYIAQLEEELGIRLFYRTTRECFLTEAGHTFYNGAKELRKDYEALMKQLGDVTENELIIGLYGEFVDMSLLYGFNKSHPEIRLKVIFDTKEALYEQLQKRRIHAVLIPDILVSSSMNNPVFRSLDIATGDPALFCSSHAIREYGSIEKVIEKLPYITKAKETEYHDYCRQVVNNNFGVFFKDITIVESRAKQQLLLELSQGFAIMLDSEVAESNDLCSFSLNNTFNETLRLYYSIKHIPNQLRVFIDYVKDAVITE